MSESNSVIISSTSRSTSTTSSSSISPSTGNESFDNDLAKVSQFFECDLDPAFADDTSPIFGVTVKLPFYGTRSRQRIFLKLIVSARPTSDNLNFNAQFHFEETQAISDGILNISQLQELLDSALHNLKGKKDFLSIVSVIDTFYLDLENNLNPEKEVVVRDFCYSIYDPRHWGRPLPGQLDRNLNNTNGQVYRAKARFDFSAVSEGELSFKEDEILYILANLGNGWLSARRSKSPSSNLLDEENGGLSGLVPENYLQRI